MEYLLFSSLMWSFRHSVDIDTCQSALSFGVKSRKDDADEALALLSEPMPESFEVDGLGSYEQPRCPNCGSFEITHQAGLDKRFALPALVAAGIPLPVPENYWKCQSCGKEWQDLDEETSAESPRYGRLRLHLCVMDNLDFSFWTGAESSDPRNLPTERS